MNVAEGIEIIEKFHILMHAEGFFNVLPVNVMPDSKRRKINYICLKK